MNKTSEGLVLWQYQEAPESFRKYVKVEQHRAHLIMYVPPQFNENLANAIAHTLAVFSYAEHKLNNGGTLYTTWT